jgi:hypothetical protein
MKIRTHVTLEPNLYKTVTEAAEREHRPVSMQLERVIEAGLKALGLLQLDTEQPSAPVAQFNEAFIKDVKEK